jgi:hypothetical protein
MQSMNQKMHYFNAPILLEALISGNSAIPVVPSLQTVTLVLLKPDVTHLSFTIIVLFSLGLAKSNI